MIDQESARSTALNYLKSHAHAYTGEIVILDEETIEKPYGWIFFYQSRAFIETGDFSHFLVGNGPIVIERTDGSIHTLPSHKHPDEVIADYKAVRR